MTIVEAGLAVACLVLAAISMLRATRSWRAGWPKGRPFAGWMLIGVGASIQGFTQALAPEGPLAGSAIAVALLVAGAALLAPSYRREVPIRDPRDR